MTVYSSIVSQILHLSTIVSTLQRVTYDIARMSQFSHWKDVPNQMCPISRDQASRGNIPVTDHRWQQISVVELCTRPMAPFSLDTIGIVMHLTQP